MDSKPFHGDSTLTFGVHSQTSFHLILQFAPLDCKLCLHTLHVSNLVSATKQTSQPYKHSVVKFSFFSASSSTPSFFFLSVLV